MTINALINFGVPGISGKRAAPLQPIMANKFRVIFHDFAGSPCPYILTQQVRVATLPRLTFDDCKRTPFTTLRFLDEISGKLFWAIMEQGRIQKATEATFKMDIELLDSTTVIRRYSHRGCEISDLYHTNDLDYSNMEALEINLTIRYIEAVVEELEESELV